MKKALLLILTAALIISSFSLNVFARDLKENENGIAYIPGELIVTVNCYVDPDGYPDSTPRDFFGVNITYIEPLFSAETEEEIQDRIDTVGSVFPYFIKLKTPFDEKESIDILTSNEAVLSVQENVVWSNTGRLIGHTEHIFASTNQEDFECTVISTKERLEGFLAVYNSNGENDGFVSFVKELSDDYFESKALVIAFINYEQKVVPVVPEVQSIVVKGSDISYLCKYTVSAEAASRQNYLIVAEVNRKHIENCNGLIEVKLYDSDTKKTTETFSDSIPYSIVSTMFGDVNSSLSFDADDYIFLKRLVFGMVNKSECKGDLLSRADIDGDGVIDADDYILLKRAYFGTYSLF